MFQHKTGQIKTFLRQWQLQSMVIPGIVWMFIFCYIPMFWLIIAFMDYNIAKPMMDSPFVGWKHFQDFVTDDRFWRSIRNTLGMSSIKLILGFPIPILFALLLNEIRSLRFKRTVQTISYLPHFIAWTIFGGIMLNWLGEGGVINQLLIAIGVQDREILFNSEPKYFWWIAFFPIRSRKWAGALSSISPPSPALIPVCTKRRNWMARAVGSECGISPFKASVLPFPSCSFSRSAGCSAATSIRSLC